MFLFSAASPKVRLLSTERVCCEKPAAASGGEEGQEKEADKNKEAEARLRTSAPFC
jgi:Fe-S oxidoreductase